jgi:hypothetical protein
MKAAFNHWIEIKKTGNKNRIHLCRLGRCPKAECSTCQVIEAALKLAKIKKNFLIAKR